MARRMDIELTSQRDEGTWTWRAAGARQPRGTLDASLLPPSAKVGDVVRAEVEGFLDGMSVVSVQPPKAPRAEPERIELLAPRSDDRPVTSSTDRRDGRRRERPRRADRPDHEGRTRSGRSDRDREREGGRRRQDRDRTRGPASDVPSPADTKPKPKRLRPTKVHRSALLDSLPAEQRPIAEQLIQGGIPAVRQAIEKQNKELKAEGKTQVNPEPLLEIAEKLRHRAQAAIWRDRADAALAHVDDLDLRDLRSVVNAAEDAGRDDEARQLAQQLREALGNRVEKEQAAWVSEVAENLREGRVVRALRLSSRPPKAGSPVPADLAEQMVVATGEALTAETGAQRWATVLDALAYSPIRRRVVPASLPEKLPSDLRETIARLATRLPDIAHIFDIEPASTTTRPPRPPKPGRRRGGKPAGEKPDKSEKPNKSNKAGKVSKATTNGKAAASGSEGNGEAEAEAADEKDAAVPAGTDAANGTVAPEAEAEKNAAETEAEKPDAEERDKESVAVDGDSPVPATDSEG